MAADVAASLVTMTVHDAVPELLRLAIGLGNVAWAVHQDDAPTHIPVPDLGRDLASTARQLTAAIERLGPETSVHGQPSVSPSVTAGGAPKSLDAVAAACRKVGQDLSLRLELVEASAVSGDGPIFTVDSAALRARWSFDDVKVLRRRLGELIQQWKQTQDHDVSYVETTTAAACQHRLTNVMSLLLICVLFYSQEEGLLLSTLSLNDNRSPLPTEETTLESKEHNPVAAADDVRSHFTKPKPSSRTASVPVNILYDFILENLAYKSMHDREQEIVKAHSGTLAWIFKGDPRSDARQRASIELTTFLSTGDLGPIYWITGKPGSGKSTLTEFLFNHAKGAELLQKWAEGDPVTTAGFFFWTSGSRDQRSQAGLLRSLLYQLLSKNLDLMPRAFPELWTKLLKSSTKERILMVLDWPVKDLMDAFQAFLDAAIEKKSRICLFIDGLDEFGGDHEAIIGFFKNISSGANSKYIKLCLSSRPWKVFENAFERAVPNLKLQDVTTDDMMAYALDRLAGEDHTREALTQFKSGEGSAFIKDMVHRADGVFLWIRLAVNRIHDKLAPHSGSEKLWAILHSMPTDLDALFTKFIFHDQNTAEIAETAVVFLLMRAREVVADFVRDESANSLTCWELVFALDGGDDDENALAYGVEQATDDTIEKLCEMATTRIMQRFCGLLMLHERRRGEKLATSPEAALTYVHRTVRDWLMDAEGIYDRLTSRAPTDFDPHLRLLRSFVLRLKRPLDEIEHHRRLDDWWHDIVLAMSHARSVRRDPGGLERAFLNEMDKTLSWYWKEKRDDRYDHWARSAFGAYEVRMKAPPIWQPFLCLATRFGLTRYVCEEVSERISRQHDNEEIGTDQEASMAETTPLLLYASEFLCSRKKSIYPLSDPQLVRGLLQRLEPPSLVNRGPNDRFLEFETRRPTTPWLMLLRHLRDAKRREWIEYYDVDPQGTKRWAEVVRLFIEDGRADVKAVIQKDAWDPEITAVGVLELLEQTYGAIEVRKLRETMVNMDAAALRQDNSEVIKT
jgi:hypothetical protein